MLPMHERIHNNLFNVLMSFMHYANGSPTSGGTYKLARAPTHVTLKTISIFDMMRPKTIIVPFVSYIIKIGKFSSIKSLTFDSAENQSKFIIPRGFESIVEHFMPIIMH